jgi:hypothetical protein
VRIQEEIKQHGDIWRLDMVDTYADLSMKTLKMFTVLPQKIDADFYFKIDDDVAVNVDAMAAYLTQRRNQGNLYLARPSRGAGEGSGGLSGSLFKFAAWSMLCTSRCAATRATSTWHAPGAPEFGSGGHSGGPARVLQRAPCIAERFGLQVQVRSRPAAPQQRVYLHQPVSGFGLA